MIINNKRHKQGSVAPRVPRHQRPRVAHNNNNNDNNNNNNNNNNN